MPLTCPEIILDNIRFGVSVVARTQDLTKFSSKSEDTFRENINEESDSEGMAKWIASRTCRGVIKGSIPVPTSLVNLRP